MTQLRHVHVSPRWLGFAGFVIVVLAAAVVGYILTPGLYPPVFDPDANAASRATQEVARMNAITTTRASILAALAGIGALITIAINYRNSSISNETFRVAERGHLTDRYAKAIGLLGDTESIAIRLGGIYALQQFALDTRRPEDQATVVEVLSAFVRIGMDVANSGAKTDSASAASEPSRAGKRRVAGRGIRPSKQTNLRANGQAPVDILAAISVLAQLPSRYGEMRADFTGVDFTGYDLSGCRLSGGNLRNVNLRGAVLVSASLNGIDLTGANLRGVKFTGATLDKAVLDHVDLTRSDLSFARLEEATLKQARIVEANLHHARLRFANLEEVTVSRSNLTNCKLVGAKMTSASIVHSDLNHVNLFGADLSQSGIAEVTLRFADLTNADLEGASLAKVDLRDALVKLDPGRMEKCVDVLTSHPDVIRIERDPHDEE